MEQPERKHVQPSTGLHRTTSRLAQASSRITRVFLKSFAWLLQDYLVFSEILLCFGFSLTSLRVLACFFKVSFWKKAPLVSPIAPCEAFHLAPSGYFRFFPSHQSPGAGGCLALSLGFFLRSRSCRCRQAKECALHGHSRSWRVPPPSLVYFDAVPTMDGSVGQKHVDEAFPLFAGRKISSWRHAWARRTTGCSLASSMR